VGGVRLKEAPGGSSVCLSVCVAVYAQQLRGLCGPEQALGSASTNTNYYSERMAGMFACLQIKIHSIYIRCFLCDHSADRFPRLVDGPTLCEVEGEQSGWSARDGGV
jgi:hypothetical protein